jgi:hypothetical protein
MKVILSRKGFDSSVGGCASPILPDGRLVSLPIPTGLDTVSYSQLRSPCGRTYLQLITELGGAAGISDRGAHVDPVLERPIVSHPDWRPSLGQVGAAAGHLRNQGVGPGDLFLFYGWFRQTIERNGKLTFAPNPGVHLIFGYLEVSDVVPLTVNHPLPSWLIQHPHAHPQRRAVRTNTVYVGREVLSVDSTRPGACVLHYDNRRVLTAPGQTRGRWRLDPTLFRGLPISYHDERAWRPRYFQSYPRAQEYVIDVNTDVRRWAFALIEP